MKLLLYAAEGEVDQVLMVVPDEFDGKFADGEADDFLNGCFLVSQVQILDDDPDFAKYRPYVG